MLSTRRKIFIFTIIVLLVSIYLSKLNFGNRFGGKYICSQIVKKSTISTQKNVIRNARQKIRFVENKGQFPSEVLFVTNLANGRVAFCSNKIVLAFVKESLYDLDSLNNRIYLAGNSSNINKQRDLPRETNIQIVTGTYQNSSLNVNIYGVGKRQEKINIFNGRDRKDWAENISTYDTLVYENIYKGIDLIFYDSDGIMKYEFAVKPGAAYSSIRIKYDGIDSMSISKEGDLTVNVGDIKIIEKKAIAFQIDGGYKKYLPTTFVLESQGLMSYHVSGFDSSLPLIIDPLFSTLIGGNGSETIHDMSIVNDSLIVLSFATTSYDLTTTSGVYQQSTAGKADVYLMLINIYTGSIISSCYFGGSENDYALALFVRGDTIRIAGYTSSTDLPTTNSAVQKSFKGQADCFIAAFSLDCKSLLFSTYIGGNGLDVMEDAFIDASGNTFLCGWTDSFNSFPRTTDAVQNIYRGGDDDAFVTEVRSDGSAILYSTFLGGDGFDEARGIHVDSLGRIVVCGYTSSSDYPVQGNPLQHSKKGVEAGFISMIDSGGKRLAYSSYFGGKYNDLFESISATDDGGYVLLGESTSTDLPVTPGVFQLKRGNSDTTIISRDMSLLRLDSSFNIVWCSYLGGSNREDAVDVIYYGGDIVVAGYSTSKDYPLKNELLSKGAEENIILTAITGAGTNILMSTLWGGNGTDYLFSMKVSNDIICLGGSTYSADFPLTPNAIKNIRTGEVDAYLTIFRLKELVLGNMDRFKIGPTSITLHQNYPNPFSVSTDIKYETRKLETLSIQIYDDKGKLVTQQRLNYVPAGTYIYHFQKNNIRSGVYFYSIASGSVTVTRKMVLID